MKNKNSIKRIFGLTVIFLIAILLIMKNNFLFSYSDKYIFYPGDLVCQEYNVIVNSYEPISDNSFLILAAPQADINTLSFHFSERILNGTNITVYMKNENGELVELGRKYLIPGKKECRIEFTRSIYPELFIQVDHAFYLDNIKLEVKESSFLMKSSAGIPGVIIVMFISLFLAVLCELIRTKTIKISEKKQIQPRETNIELLRVICMLLIIAHHCVTHGGAVNMDYSGNKLISYIFLPVGKIGFCTFIAISMWFLVDQEFKASRFLKTWLQVCFYSIIFTIIAILLGKKVSIIEFFSSFLPMLGNSHGFAASYLLFYLLLPFMAKATVKLNKKQARYLLTITFLVQVLSQIIGAFIGYYQPVYSEVGLFIFGYILSLNLKRWPAKLLENKIFTGTLALAVWILLLQLYYMELWGKGNTVSRFILSISGTESSILMIIAGYALFFFAKNIKMKSNAIINKIATYTFGVLLIHDHNFFRTIVWDYFIETRQWYYSKHFFTLLIVCVISIFFVCAVIDYFRKIVLENSIFYSTPVHKVIQKWDLLISGKEEPIDGL